MRWTWVIVVFLFAGACSDPTPEAGVAATTTATTTTTSGPAPTAVVPLPPGADAAIERAIDDVVAMIGESTNPVDPAVFDEIAGYDDIRLGWILADMGQFVFRGESFDALLRAANRLSGGDYTNRTVWKGLSDQLITEDIAAPPGYEQWKRELLSAVDVTWIHFFDDPEAEIDWRLVTFGGVLADTRPLGSEASCACIPGLDDPPSVAAADGDWYPDRRVVFGVEINGESRAYPLNIMEAHEMANDELGGRRIALTYCTLCRSAVAFYVDDLPTDITPPVLRTSGLLRRSNKLVFDRESLSLIDQFTGEALSGPLREADVQLDRVTVVTSTWAKWRAAHPETTLMAGKDGNGPNYPLDPLGERDAGGPIFPIGEVDTTLFASQAVVGTILDDGSALAFPLDAALDALDQGEPVSLGGVSVIADGSGVRLVNDNGGTELTSSQAAWFAWSQRFPDTQLWSP